MSYDLWVYSPSPQRVLKEHLRAALRQRGWEIAFVSDATSSKRAFLAMEGLIENETLVIGWQAEDENAALLTRTAAGQDIRMMEAIVETTQSVAGCAVSVTIPYQVDEQELADMTVKGEVQYARVLKSAQSHYYLRTAAGRSPLSFEFQRLVWLTFGEVYGGLLADPQNGEYIILDASHPVV